MSQAEKGEGNNVITEQKELIPINKSEDQIIECINYSNTLTASGLSYIETNNHLQVGQIPTNILWVIHLSVTVLDGLNLLELVLPILKKKRIPFQVLKTNYVLNKANGYGYGLKAVGKFIEIYPDDEEEAIAIVSSLQALTDNFGGPEVKGATRIGKIIYVSCAQEYSNANLPFYIPKAFRKKKKKRIMGRYYIPVHLLRDLPKGQTIKAINFRRLNLNWCLIKQGKKYATDDFFGRDMISRINWQYQVLKELSGLKSVPNPIDLYSDDEAAYLVLEYTEGITLRKKIQHICDEKKWNELTENQKKVILSYYLSAVIIVQQVHDHGYIHRDINDENFIVSEKGKLTLIDFELSWSIERNYPTPVFGLGTFGYMSPQQFRYMHPTKSDDVFSLGAILSFILTGIDPNELLNAGHDLTLRTMCDLTDNSPLCSLAIDCLNPDALSRPTLKSIADKIQQFL